MIAKSCHQLGSDLLGIRSCGKEMKRLARKPEPKRSIGLINAARRFNADYLLYNGVFDARLASEQSATIVLANPEYTLLKVSAP